jgi:hypothetical protein
MSKQLEEYFDFEEPYDQDEEGEITTPLQQYILHEEEELFSETNLNFFQMAKEKINKTHKMNRTKTLEKSKKLIISFEEDNENFQKNSKEFQLSKEIKFSLKVKQFVQMNFEATTFSSVLKMTVNPIHKEMLIDYAEEHGYHYYRPNDPSPLEWKKIHLNCQILEDEFIPMNDLSCLRRYFHAQCVIGSTIFMHGGLDEKKVKFESFKAF